MHLPQIGVKHEVGHHTRSDEGGMLIHCNRGATTKTEPVPPQPGGPMGVAGDLVVAIRRR